MSGAAPAARGQPPLPASGTRPEPARPGEPAVAVQFAGSPAPDAEAIAGWAAAALDGDPRHVCIRLVDRTEGAALNARYRGRQAATNVLSFPADEAGLLGDIAICAPVVAAEARAQEKPLDAHFAHMVVHGVLHLRGMDHANDVDAARMEARETALLRTLGFADPYPPA